MLKRVLGPWLLKRYQEGAVEVSLTWRNRLPLVLVLVFVLLELVTPSRVWKTLIVGFLSLMGIAFFWAWQLARWLRAERRMPVDWVQVGDSLAERFSVTNGTFLPAPWFEVHDTSELPGYSVSSVRSVGGNTTYRWTTKGECRLRGEYDLGPWELETGDPFGIFRVVQRNQEVHRVLVYPPIAENLPVTLPSGAAAGPSRLSQRSWAPTVSVGGVRSYVPGDPRRHVHWPTTARRDSLFIKEFDQESGGDVWLALDLDRDVHVGQGETSTEEYAVILAASVAAHLLDAGRAVGLLAHGQRRTMVPPARGRGHLFKLLSALARVHAVEANPLARVLDQAGRALPVGISVMAITPSLDTGWISAMARLRGRGMGVSALLLDPVSFQRVAEQGKKRMDQVSPLDVGAGDISPALSSLRMILADAQIPTQVVTADMALALRPVTGSTRRWEFKVFGTGHVVAVTTPWGT